VLAGPVALFVQQRHFREDGVPMGSRVLSAATAAIGKSGMPAAPTTSLVGRRSKKT
jgi:hypothetical protein